MFSSIRGWFAAAAILLAPLAAHADDAAARLISGAVTDEAGKPMHGVMITALDSERRSSVSVLSQADGKFAINDATAGTDQVRARLIGFSDQLIDLGEAEGAAPLKLVMHPAEPEELINQMRGSDRLKLLKFDNEKDALNFRMMCTYCHQVGTQGFRTPEEPVDWEVMITRMDGYGGLYKHTQESIVKRIVDTYGPDAEAKWPKFTPPPAPSGKALDVKVYEWQMGVEDNCMIHDLDIGKDGKIYTVDMTNDAVEVLDPKTAERKVYGIPGGKEPGSDDLPIKGPHSLEPDANGDMWITLALSGEMAKFNVKTGEYLQVSSNVAGRKRGAYPHTLRVDAKGVVWYTDAGMNSVFSLDPNANNVVKEYKLLKSDQAEGAGRGESRGITPYGVTIAPDGKVWYSKLNGQRIGRIDPSQPDGSPDQIKEWQPPVHGPRRLEVGPDNLVWTPGWASGDVASFNEKTGEWKVYKLPEGAESMPYALSVHPKTGDVWICGTGFDTMIRLEPKTGEMTVYPMPTQVTYTREVEFDDEGNVWVCNSNYPVRHVENHFGSLIKIVLPAS